MSPRGALAALCAVLCAALMVACPENDEDDDLGESSGDPSSSNGASSSTGMNPPPCGELGHTFTDPECGACAEASCCAELSACDANLACGELIACRASCFDAICVDQCASEFGAGATDLAAVDACLAGPCLAGCPMPTGICGSDFTSGNVDCDGCLDPSCCTQLSDCLADAACYDCMTMGVGDCAGDALFAAAKACFQQSCASACPQ